ncbi:MAG: hypothetical protein WA991_02460 [Ornithinimicrobium sp.]
MQKIPPEGLPPGTRVAPDWIWIPLVVGFVALLAVLVPLLAGDLSLGRFSTLFLPILPIVALIWVGQRVTRSRR